MSNSPPSAVNGPPKIRSLVDRDFDLEVLTFLPPAPSYAVVGDIAYDLNAPGRQPVLDALRRLKVEYAVVVGNNPVDRGRVAWVEPGGWRKVQNACEKHLSVAPFP